MSKKCECDGTGRLIESNAYMYDTVKELPFVVHEPGECKCTNKLQTYRRNGKLLTLCSCCHGLGDEPVKEGVGQ